MARTRIPVESTPREGFITSLLNALAAPPPPPDGPQLDDAPPRVNPSRVLFLQGTWGNTGATGAAQPTMVEDASASQREEAVQEIRRLCGLGWVAPWHEGRLERLWTSFGADLEAVRAAHPELWETSIGRGAELAGLVADVDEMAARTPAGGEQAPSEAAASDVAGADEQEVCSPEEQVAAPLDGLLGAAGEVCDVDGISLETEQPGEVCELEPTGTGPSLELGEQQGEPSFSFAPMPLRPWPVSPSVPPTVTPVGPTTPLGPAPVGGGALVAALAWAARRLPALVGLWPKPTAPPELDQAPLPEPDAAPPPRLEPKVGPETDDDPCRMALVCPHKGGDTIHNACADFVTDPELQGCDVLVNGKHYDAYNKETRTLWEVKTADFGRYNDYVAKVEAQKQIASAMADAQKAEECGFNFVLSVSELNNYRALEEALGGLSPFKVVFRPECL